MMKAYIVGCRGMEQPGGPSTWLVPVGPTKVKAHKSIVFTEGTPEAKLKNTCST